MNDSILQKAASQFGQGEPLIEPFGAGLINHSYKVGFNDGSTVLLQCINQATFSQPENIIHNYRVISDELRLRGHTPVPPLVQTRKGKYFWLDENGNFWRATRFIENAYSDTIPASAAKVYLAAKCFAEFSTSLNRLDPDRLEIIIPRFHDLDHRYEQFEQAIMAAGINRLLKATHVISSLRERFDLVMFYREAAANTGDYPVRIMHHDCKISNILFDKISHEVICPVDLDTVMPGRFFSDIGDMVRTMACSREENSIEWENIEIVPEYYHAIIDGYVDGSQGTLTRTETRNINYAGRIMIYMQCLRFTTDFLNNDIYYKTQYPEQNLNRALNQLILLEKLEQLV
ncbi:MAG: aminoglycoside phosphotransferase family protein [Chitinophagaceae bacterium]|nr:MAG: aminoglycoside phosphotransferase family protein [Chitinophagaceae bacterium]